MVIKNLIYLLGGIIISFSFSNECQAQTWTDKDEDESYIARHECGFVQCGNKFFLFGGRESPRVVDIYDYDSDSWTNGGLAPEDLNHFQAVEYEGLIWVIGAFKTNSPNPEQNADYIYMYNPATEQWIQGMEIPSSRKRGSAGIAVYNNKFYLLGGNNIGHAGGYVPYFDEFNPQTGVWSQLTDAPRSRDHFQAAVVGNKLFAIGGRLTGGSGGLFEPQVAEVDVYNFNTNTWSTLDNSKNFPHPRAGLAVVVFNDEIFTIAGESTFGSPTNNNSPRDLVQAYNPNTESWSNKASINYRRHGIQAIASGNGIHIVAGSQGGSAMKNMEFYGIDNPVGNPNVNSTFQPDELTKSFTYDEDDGSITVDIILSNSDGTTGTYIDAIEVTGANFSLEESYNNRLLGANSSLIITVILTDTTNEESNGLLTITYNNNSSIEVVLDGELDGTLSVKDVEQNHLILIPTPSKESFTLNKSVSDIKIYDLTGKVVKEFKGSFSKNFVFSISELPANLYVIRAKDYNGQTFNTKLLKK